MTLKKKYIAPTATVVEVNTSTLLTGSLSLDTNSGNTTSGGNVIEADSKGSAWTFGNCWGNN